MTLKSISRKNRLNFFFKIELLQKQNQKIDQYICFNIIIISLVWKFLTPALANDFSLDFKW